MDTLIQLRQPQLSKKPDEGSLSAALTEALPPLSTDLLTDVADAFNQLEEDRRQLQDYQALARYVGQFTDRYRTYARTQTRRQARGLRSAQTGFDNASRAANEARSELAALEAAEEEANGAHSAAEEIVATNRTRWEVLLSDPANKDANRLDSAAREASDRKREAEQADARSTASKSRFVSEQGATFERGERLASIGGQVLDVRKAALPLAQLSGTDQQWNQGLLTGSDIAELAELNELACEAAKSDLRQIIERRRGQVAHAARQGRQGYQSRGPLPGQARRRADGRHPDRPWPSGRSRGLHHPPRRQAGEHPLSRRGARDLGRRFPLRCAAY